MKRLTLRLGAGMRGLATLALWPSLARAAAPAGTPADVLDSLRDIHEPAPPPLWPPAPGWWVLALLVLVALVLAVRALLRRQRAAAPMREAQRLVDEAAAEHAAADDPQRALVRLGDALAEVLRRAALMRYPRTVVAHLSGDAWLEFLDETGATTAFTRGPGRLLGNLRYARSADADLDPDAAIKAARAWLKRHTYGAPTLTMDSAADDENTDRAATGKRSGTGTSTASSAAAAATKAASNGHSAARGASKSGVGESRTGGRS